MANIASAFNEHFRRLARREIRANTRKGRKQAAQHRRDIAALKRAVAALARSVSLMERQERRRGGKLPAIAAQGAEMLRFRADGLKTHRAKLGISAADYGKLVGVSGLTIYHWESRKAKPRRGQLPKLAAVRGVGKREAMRRLDLLAK